MQRNEVKSLIESIKSQTEHLKVFSVLNVIFLLKMKEYCEELRREQKSDDNFAEYS